MGCRCCTGFTISRRAFLLGAAGGMAGACAGPATPRRPPEPLGLPASLTADNLPFVDFHTHVQKRVTPEQLVAYMDQARVGRMVLMPLAYGDQGGAVNDGEGSDEQALDYARRFPGRFIPFVGMQRPALVNRNRWISPDAVATSLVAETDWKLRSGAYFGMGEFMLRFYPYTTSMGIVAISDMDYPADSRLMESFAVLSATYRVPMVIHCEAEPDPAAAMLRLLERNPEATIVWAHNCGRSSAAAIRTMLERYPNLHADLGNMMNTGPEGYGNYWPRRTPWMHLIARSGGRLFPEMKALFEEFPDRFVVGTDTAHARAYQGYEIGAMRWRIFFEQLTPDTARKIAYENAERLFRRGTEPRTL